MDECIYTWIILYGWISSIYLFIYPWLEDKWIKNYLYMSSFVVQILIFQTWMPFNNDE
jgi:hypothetical protein